MKLMSKFIYRFCILLIIIVVKAVPGYSQHHDHSMHLHGTVYGLELHETHQDTIPLAGANIFWQGTNNGTTTNSDGIFHLDKPGSDQYKLIINYIAYENDTLLIPANENNINVILYKIRKTESISISSIKPNTFQMKENTINTQVISKNGLQTMACCSLSESFENTSAVDVETNDAISGAKRIKMLGLAGFYTQVLVEKKPVIRGLVSPYALEYIPGNWMESIDISKGTASVMNGYESTTGQINVEYRKPEDDGPMFLNIYQNSLGKAEASVGSSYRVNKKISTMLLSYGNMNRIDHDDNSDTFLDMPNVDHLHLMNRWKLENTNGWVGQLGINYLHDNRKGGQLNYNFDLPSLNQSEYGYKSNTRRVEWYTKLGKQLDNKGSSSIGLVLSAFQHKNAEMWGQKSYDGSENSVYGNLSYQKKFNNQTLATGISYIWDDIQEYYNHTLYKRSEKVPGAFVEYTWKPNSKFTTIFGFRYDDHNLYGDFYTPRMHMKYLLTESSSVRISAGKGYRSPFIFTENLSILASSRKLNILEPLDAEEAVNYGLQYSYDFTLGFARPTTFMIDFYRTDFQNRIIVDLEQDAGEIFIYNLNGKSYSNSLQVEINSTLFSGLEGTVAWHWNDSKMTINNQMLEQPLTNRNKGLLVLSYTTNNNKWQFDFTTQLNSKSRLPNTENNPPQYITDKYSPRYVMLYGQITKKINFYDFYIGMENITNYKQTNPIIAWQEPHSPYFDSSMIWGPIIGRRLYLGIRIH